MNTRSKKLTEIKHFRVIRQNTYNNWDTYYFDLKDLLSLTFRKKNPNLIAILRSGYSPDSFTGCVDSESNPIYENDIIYIYADKTRKVITEIRRISYNHQAAKFNCDFSHLEKDAFITILGNYFQYGGDLKPEKLDKNYWTSTRTCPELENTRSTKVLITCSKLEDYLFNVYLNTTNNYFMHFPELGILNIKVPPQIIHAPVYVRNDYIKSTLKEIIDRGIKCHSPIAYFDISIPKK